ncbi:MAG: FkbM family methyltransferase [Spirochaetia bacterium]
MLLPTEGPWLTEAIRTSIERGRYEAREAQVISRLLTRGQTVMEVGGGIGFLSAYCAKVAGAGRVVTYEANPELIPVIKQVHALNGVDAEVRDSVLAEHDGETQLHIAPAFWSSSTIEGSGVAKAGHSIRVKTERIDRALDDVKPDILIVDIEGGEQLFFNSIHSLSAKSVVIELHPKQLHPHAINAIFFRMFELGYTYDCAHSQGPVVALTRIH